MINNINIIIKNFILKKHHRFRSKATWGISIILSVSRPVDLKAGRVDNCVMGAIAPWNEGGHNSREGKKVLR